MEYPLGITGIADAEEKVYHNLGEPGNLRGRTSVADRTRLHVLEWVHPRHHRPTRQGRERQFAVCLGSTRSDRKCIGQTTGTVWAGCHWQGTRSSRDCSCSSSRRVARSIGWARRYPSAALNPAEPAREPKDGAISISGRWYSMCALWGGLHSQMGSTTP